MGSLDGAELLLASSSHALSHAAAALLPPAASRKPGAASRLQQSLKKLRVACLNMLRRAREAVRVARGAERGHLALLDDVVRIGFGEA